MAFCNDDSTIQELIRWWDNELELFTTILHVLQNTKKANLLRLTNETIASQVLCIKSWIYESATVHLAVIEYLYRGRRAVPLQTFTTRHSNSKLSIVMALSSAFRQCAPETTKFGKITLNKGHFAVEGHSRSPILVPIERSYTTSY